MYGRRSEVLTHEEARELLSAARSSRSGKPLANNTRLHGPDVADAGAVFNVRLHATDIVRIHPRDVYELHTDGWQTVTTKERLNRFSPADVFSVSGVWCVTSGKPEARPEYPRFPAASVDDDGAHERWQAEMAEYRRLDVEWHERHPPVAFFDGIRVNRHGFPLVKDARKGARILRDALEVQREDRREAARRKRAAVKAARLVAEFDSGGPANSVEPFANARALAAAGGAAYARRIAERMRAEMTRPIAGYRAAVKATREDGNPGHGVIYSAGEFVAAFDWQATARCGAGLHFCDTPSAAAGYVSTWAGGRRFFLCGLPAGDVVNVEGDKIKAPWAVVFKELDAGEVEALNAGTTSARAELARELGVSA